MPNTNRSSGESGSCGCFITSIVNGILRSETIQNHDLVGHNMMFSRAFLNKEM